MEFWNDKVGFDPRLRREAEDELCQRARRGALVLPPVLLALVGTTTIAEKAPAISLTAVLVLTSLCVIRLYEADSFPHLDELRRKAWMTRFRITFLGCSAVFSALGSYLVLELYGREWEPMFFIAALCGMAAGGVTSVVPDFRLLKAFLVILLLPTGAACMVESFYGPGVTLIIFTLYMVGQGRGYSKTYWSGLRDKYQLLEKSEALEGALAGLTEASERFRSAFETAPIGIGIIRSDGKLIHGNEQLAETLGLARESLSEFPMQTLFAPSLGQGFLDSLRTGSELECELLRPDGESVWAIFKAGLQPQKDEGLDCFIGQFVDITQRKMAEAALQRTKKVQALGVLAAGIAHEINTPLQFVTDNLVFLRDAVEEISESLEPGKEALDPTLPGEAQEAISDSLDGMERVSTIVASIRSITHGGSSEKRPIDLKVTILNALSVSASAWKGCADLKTDFDESLPPVQGDEGELGQVFLNLIVNAAQAIQENAECKSLGQLSIVTRRDKGFAEVRVTDSGAGIDEKIVPLVFDPFFTTKEVGKGTGQGLAISQSVVNQHGGEIFFETREGQGTTFVVRLPIEAA